jgi:hypothetical protein
LSRASLCVATWIMAPDAKTLRWNDLKTHAFSEAESYEMVREAYEGERELASKPKQHADLLKMLGLSPQNMPQTNLKPDVPGAEMKQSPDQKQLRLIGLTKLLRGPSRHYQPKKQLLRYPADWTRFTVISLAKLQTKLCKDCQPREYTMKKCLLSL